MRIPPPIGFPLLPSPDESGQLRWPRLERSVEDALRVVLSTRPGEQLMRPGFGAGLDRFLNEPDSVETRRRVHDAVVESLRAWEPRIAIERVEVADVPSRPGHLRVEITYALLRNGESRRLGLTLRTGV
jgi:phage baseplate assembly protein W